MKQIPMLEKIAIDPRFLAKMVIRGMNQRLKSPTIQSAMSLPATFQNIGRMIEKRGPKFKADWGKALQEHAHLFDPSLLPKPLSKQSVAPLATSLPIPMPQQQEQMKTAAIQQRPIPTPSATKITGARIQQPMGEPQLRPKALPPIIRRSGGGGYAESMRAAQIPATPVEAAKTIPVKAAPAAPASMQLNPGLFQRVTRWVGGKASPYIGGERAQTAAKIVGQEHPEGVQQMSQLIHELGPANARRLGLQNPGTGSIGILQEGKKFYAAGGNRAPIELPRENVPSSTRANMMQTNQPGAIINLPQGSYPQAARLNWAQTQMQNLGTKTLGYGALGLGLAGLGSYGAYRALSSDDDRRQQPSVIVNR